MNWRPVAKWVAIGLAIILVVKMIRDDGAQSVTNTIERQNNAAAQKSDTDRLGYDACVDAGGLWDFGAGKCRRSP
jgi:uncharacterized membrane protein YjfL (UPF0719 family)